VTVTTDRSVKKPFAIITVTNVPFHKNKERMRTWAWLEVCKVKPRIHNRDYRGSKVDQDQRIVTFV